MKHKGRPNTLEMQVKVGYLTRLKDNQIARPGLQYNPWFIQPKFPSNTLLKSEDCTEVLISYVSVSGGGDVEVKDKT